MNVILMILGVITLSLASPVPDRGGGYKPHGGGHDPHDGGYKHKDGYFQYVNVPAHKEYEFGFNRGNPHHYISRFEQLKDHAFRTRVKWADKHDGYGEHYWEYNHVPKYKPHDDHHEDPYHKPVHHHEDPYKKPLTHHVDPYKKPFHHKPVHGFHHDNKGYHSDLVPKYKETGSDDFDDILSGREDLKTLDAIPHYDDQLVKEEEDEEGFTVPIYQSRKINE